MKLRMICVNYSVLLKVCQAFFEIFLFYFFYFFVEKIDFDAENSI